MILQASKRLRKFFNKDITDQMIWQEIIKDGNLSNIHQLRTLSADAARALISHEKRMQLLSLGISELQPEVAAELVKYKGEKLFLNCVNSISPDTAKVIAQFSGIKLMLNGIATISITILGKLAGYRGTLHMDSVERIDIPQEEIRRAETVFNHLEFARLSLSALQKPSETLLKAFSRFKGHLELNGIESLSKRDSEILSGFLGHALFLKGIKYISTDYRDLLKFKGFLDLSNAWDIQDEVLDIASIRPDENSLFNSAVKKKIDSYRIEISRKNELERQERQKRTAQQDEKKRIDDILLLDFEKFDSIAPPTTPHRTGDESTQSRPDEFDMFSNEIDQSIVEDIELNLNYQISLKKRVLDFLLSKNIDILSEKEKEEIHLLRNEIEGLKDKIRSTLDILVERKELGAVIFTSTDDLVSYLKESGSNEIENNALDNIEKEDIFDSSFVNGKDGLQSSIEFAKSPIGSIEGEDFVFTHVS